MRPKFTSLAVAVAAGIGLITLMRRIRPKRESSRISADRDLVDEASIQSFPASDPPSWTLGEESDLSR